MAPAPMWRLNCRHGPRRRLRRHSGSRNPSAAPLRSDTLMPMRLCCAVWPATCGAGSRWRAAMSSATAICVVIVSGTQHGIRLCVDALLSPGDAVWMEDPGYYAARNTLETVGMKLVPLTVDARGIVVASGLRFNAAAKAAYVTPSHQFPTGVTMSMARRVALLDWARASKAWIIEDDYDSEFRFAGPPLTALAGLGAERVIYVGTFTKTLFAGLRLAYLVLPPGVVERVVRARAAHDRFPPQFMQDAVADLIS